MQAHFEHWPERVPRTLQAPQTSLWQNLATSAQRYPDKAALQFLGRAISYAELAHAAERLAAHLHAVGVGRGDRVLVMMQNLPQLVIAHFAVLRANAVVVPLNPMLRAGELAHYISDAQARVAIATQDLAAELVTASDGLADGQGLAHLVVAPLAQYLPAPAQRSPMPESWQDWLQALPPACALRQGQVWTWQQALASDAPAPSLQVGPQDLAVLPYTSGTTGVPKGCMHTHASIMFNAVASTVWGSGCSENVALAAIPMFHITGLVVVMHAHIYLGATLVLLPRWDREMAGRAIAQYQVTSWTNIPTMVIDLLASPNFQQFDLSSLQYIGGGGAAMPQAVAQRLYTAYGLRYQEGYGLTETAAPTHSNPVQHAKQQCLGIPFIGTQALVIDPDSLQPQPVDAPGEIVVHGPQLFAGYWGHPEATEAAFVALEGVRYFRTGDLGHVDGQGYFFITDRLKRMINASGFKVWPAEVEAQMFHHPDIQEACVIAAHDPYRGETVKAVVVLRAGARDTCSPEDIMAWCRAHMAAYKVPRQVSLVEALPKSGSGKVMWRLLQAAEHGQA